MGCQIYIFFKMKFNSWKAGLKIHEESLTINVHFKTLKAQKETDMSFIIFPARQPVIKRTWAKEEVLAVEKHMMSFITTCRVPGKSDCDKCLEQEKVALRNRNWLAVKFYIKNRITALKRKV